MPGRVWVFLFDGFWRIGFGSAFLYAMFYFGAKYRKIDVPDVPLKIHVRNWFYIACTGWILGFLANIPRILSKIFF